MPHTAYHRFAIPLSSPDRRMTQKTPPSPSGSSRTFPLVHLFHGREDWKEKRAPGNKAPKLCSRSLRTPPGCCNPCLAHCQGPSGTAAAAPAVRLPEVTQGSHGEAILWDLHLSNTSSRSLGKQTNPLGCTSLSVKLKLPI